ncbi:urease accessory protein UreD [Georgenia subflava]|nr:urease accessory protein UreD [Georgenia subflava]
MRSQAPLVLRPTVLVRDEPGAIAGPQPARVSVAAGAAGPIGGDHLSLDIDVGPGSTLVLGEISARLLLPGPHAEQSRSTTTVRVDRGGTLIWLPQPMIAATGCRHLNDVHVELAEGARLLLREEVVLGRHEEVPGTLAQHVRVRRAGRPLYDQRLDFGPEAIGWDSPAVAGSSRALGSVLVVDPSWADATPPAQPLGEDAAVLPLSGPAVLISATSPDSLTLRRALTTGLRSLGHPWAPSV